MGRIEKVDSRRGPRIDSEVKFEGSTRKRANCLPGSLHSVAGAPRTARKKWPTTPVEMAELMTGSWAEACFGVGHGGEDDARTEIVMLR
jgi:hypothetical protein